MGEIRVTPQKEDFGWEEIKKEELEGVRNGLVDE